YYNQTNPHVLIDNFQIQAQTSTATEPLTYVWSADTGLNAGLPNSATIASATNDQITVNPLVTTNYTVTVTNLDGCPATFTKEVVVNPAPVITFTTNYCPSSPHNNEVEIIATSSIPGTTWQWNITYPSGG